MSEVYLGLRSNAAWFAGPATYEQLVRRLKSALLIYDEVGVQEGSYRCTVGTRNSSEWFIGPGEGAERSAVRFHEVGSPFALRMRPSESTGPMQTIFTDTAEISYAADFYPILKEAGLLEVPYLRRLEIDLSQEAKTRVQSAAQWALRDAAFAATLPENPSLKKYIVQGLYIDAMMALEIGAPLVIDDHASAVVQWQVRAQQSAWSMERGSTIQAAWTSMGLPDLTGLPWDDVLRLRESATGRDYRRMISEVSAKLVEGSLAGLNEAELHQIAVGNVSRELVEQIAAGRSSAGGLIVKLFLNLIPKVGVLGIGADILEHVSRGRSWIGLLEHVGRR